MPTSHNASYEKPFNPMTMYNQLEITRFSDRAKCPIIGLQKKPKWKRKIEAVKT